MTWTIIHVRCMQALNKTQLLMQNGARCWGNFSTRSLKRKAQKEIVFIFRFKYFILCVGTSTLGLVYVEIKVAHLLDAN